MDELDPFAGRLGQMLAAVEPAGRARLAATVARALRQSQAARIAAQLNPDGTPYAPRRRRLRAQKGKIKRRAMFSKLRTARWMKVETSPSSAAVTFLDRVQRMAQVHQYGLRDRVNRYGGPEVQYPARELLGLTDAEVSTVEDLVLAHLSSR